MLIGKDISEAIVKLSKLRKKRLVQILVNILYYQISDYNDFKEIVHYIYTLENISLYNSVYKDR